MRRWSKNPELLILVLAVVIAVAASSAVSLFSDRVGRALDDQSGEAFGADTAISSRDPLGDELHVGRDEARLDRRDHPR